MSVAIKSKYTPQEYLEIERKAETKSEYFNGEIFALAGASKEHILIVTNIIVELGTQLKKRPCQVYSTDMKVKALRSGLYTYPDIIVVCDKPEFEDEHKDILLNPTLIAEVLSESTEAYDRGKKFEHYRNVESLKEYLLIAQDKHSVEQFIKQNDGSWLFLETSDSEGVVRLRSINCELLISDVYHKVELE
jgi:Uma2 family endonuclease